MQWKAVHFIGIGGVGMSATAKLLRDAGVRVSGSDEAVYPPISDFLRQEKFDVLQPYSAQNIPSDVDAIIIGKNARLVPETNEEVAAALQSGKPILSFPDVLAQLSKDSETVVVAGSYGKSTSTALMAHCLMQAGLDPSFFIGASPLTPSTSARMGTGPLFVLEGDEYPSSNSDPRSKFLHYHPAHMLLTPLAHDHFNIFPTPEDYLKPFYELAELLPANAIVAAATSGPLSKEFLLNISRQVVSYGVHEGEFAARNILWGETTTFDIIHNDAVVVHVETSQLGEHNIENILGVAALVFSLGLMEPYLFAEAVKSFKGIRRRLDKKSEKTSIPVFEGFGSSYDKMRSALKAMKQHFAQRRLLVVFEPNTIGWRSRAALGQYDDVFAGAAKVYVFAPPHDGKETEVSTEDITARVREGGIEAQGFAEPDALLNMLKEDLQKNDCILLSSSGAMGGLIEHVPQLAEEKFPA